MDKYVRGKRLGRGSFGTVYQVWRRDATVGAAALGVLKEMVIHDVEQRCGARQEALVLSRLDHPNVIRYLDSFQVPRGRRIPVRNSRLGTAPYGP